MVRSKVRSRLSPLGPCQHWKSSSTVTDPVLSILAIAHPHHPVQDYTVHYTPIRHRCPHTLSISAHSICPLSLFFFAALFYHLSSSSLNSISTHIFFISQSVPSLPSIFLPSAVSDSLHPAIYSLLLSLRGSKGWDRGWKRGSRE